jgi:hypothetical protein
LISHEARPGSLLDKKAVRPGSIKTQGISGSTKTNGEGNLSFLTGKESGKTDRGIIGGPETGNEKQSAKTDNPG